MANYSKNKKYHYTYKTTNLINGRYYLGMHSTNRLDDGYLGSGKRLYYELNKYGRDNFKFEILKQLESREKLIKAERKLITEQDLANEDCLNIVQGGGGFTTESAYTANSIRNELLKTNYNWKVEYGKKIREGLKCYIESMTHEEREKRISFLKDGYSTYVKLKGGSFKNKKHSEETKKKIGIANSKLQKGKNNSQYGTCWITNEKENTKIRKGDTIPEGWRLGRKLK